MNFKSIFFIAFTTLILSSCSSSPKSNIPFIKGYWEIKEVQKDNKLIKEYTISTIVDYFEVNDDLSGFRKKVTPTLEGSFMVTQDQAPFNLKVENDSLNIYYNQNNVVTKETIIKASKKELIIVNSQGFRYIYKPYKSLNIVD